MFVIHFPLYVYTKKNTRCVTELKGKSGMKYSNMYLCMHEVAIECKHTRNHRHFNVGKMDMYSLYVFEYVFESH